MIVPDSIHLTTDNGTIIRIKVSDCLSAYQRIPAWRIDLDVVDENDNVRDHIAEFSKNLDKTTGDGAIPNGDIPYVDDSVFAVACAYFMKVSHNTLRNNVPTGGVVVDGGGNIVGVDLSAQPYSTIQGYKPGDLIPWVVGSGGMFKDDHVKSYARVNEHGNITPNSFLAPNGRPLSASNPIPPKNGRPWQQGQWFRPAPPPLRPGEKANLDFGIADVNVWQPATEPGPGSCFFSQTFAGGPYAYLHVARANENGQASMEHYVSSPGNTSRCGDGYLQVWTVGHGVSTNGALPGHGHAVFDTLHVGDYEVSQDPSRKIVMGGYLSYIAWRFGGKETFASGVENHLNPPRWVVYGNNDHRYKVDYR